jgi:hypothetical protein
MGNMQFEDPTGGLERFAPRQFEVRGMAGFLMRKGVVKSESAANLILVGVIVLSLVVIIWIFSATFGGPKVKHYTPEALQQMQHLFPAR